MRQHGHETTLIELVAAARAGDMRSWADLMVRFRPAVWSVVVSFHLQDADADDVVQNTWLRALERLDTLQYPERFGGWLQTVARNECRALLSMTGREQLGTIDVEHVEQAPGPEAQVLLAEMIAAVRTAVDGLSGRRRSLAEVFLHEARPDYGCVAGAIGMPVGSIGPTRARTFADLRVRLERTGFAPGHAPVLAPALVMAPAGPR